MSRKAKKAVEDSEKRVPEAWDEEMKKEQRPEQRAALPKERPIKEAKRATMRGIGRKMEVVIIDMLPSKRSKERWQIRSMIWVHEDIEVK